MNCEDVSPDLDWETNNFFDELREWLRQRFQQQLANMRRDWN